MLQEADVVVIGAGAFGASTAYHLAKRGVKRVALLDKHDPASQNSSRAAGLTAQVRGTDLMTTIAMMGVQGITRFVDEVGQPLVYERSGSMKIARNAVDEAQLRSEVETGRRLGLEIDLISPAEAKRLAPYVETEGILAVTYTPSDVYLEPGQLPRGYARAAELLGATVLSNTPVTGIIAGAKGVERVITDQGEIRTPLVVDAAGAWARLVGAMAGGRVPVVPTRHQLLISEPIAGIVEGMPIVRVIDANVYVRPDKGGILLGGYEPDPIQYEMGDLPSSFQIKDLPLDLAPLRGLADAVADQLPLLQELSVREHRGGLPTMTPDGRQLVGPVPGVPGLFVAGGCCVGGLSISPAIGSILAEWIVTGKQPLDLGLLAPDRFDPASYPEDRLRRESQRRYSHHYRTH